MSATGNSRSGFTLIEMMVVVVIIGVMLGVTVITLFGSQFRHQLHSEATTLYKTLRILALDAELHGNEWGMQTREDGYGFMRFDRKAQNWVSDPLADAHYTLPDSITLSLNQPEHLVLPEAKNLEQPDILLLSSGQISAFELTLQVNHMGDERAVIHADAKSDLSLTEGAPDERAQK